ncbi:MAG: response regulator [Cyanobacteria bacterium P01_D01_bin.36]
MSHAANQTILIVDDMPTNVEVLAGALMKAGYQVAVALDGESAIAQIQYKSPALILLDVMMPGIDGFETCRRLKDSPKTQTIPIIFMTALSETVNKSKGFSLGAVDYITKPFDAQEVLARVGTHLKLHQLTTELEATVESRTAELTSALEQLQQTQTQLIQSERMSLVGEISAGIAYEMSNPVNYIRGNLRHLETNLTQLLAFAEDVHPQLQSFKDSDEATCQVTLTQLSEAALDLDFEFVREDLPKILGSFNRGTDKIQQLISNLRTFADSDKSGQQTVDIHELLEGCLSLLGHKLQAKTRRNAIQVNKDYQSIPKIKCYPAALSQALIGILLSYIDRSEATKNDETGALPQISVQTACQSEDWVVIKLSIGISHIFSPSSASYDAQNEKEQLLANLDDMNLMLAHGILTQQHQGRLHQQTENGHTFVTLELPLKQATSVVLTDAKTPTNSKGLTSQQSLTATAPVS